MENKNIDRDWLRDDNCHCSKCSLYNCYECFHCCHCPEEHFTTTHLASCIKNNI